MEHNIHVNSLPLRTEVERVRDFRSVASEVDVVLVVKASVAVLVAEHVVTYAQVVGHSDAVVRIILGQVSLKLLLVLYLSAVAHAEDGVERITLLRAGVARTHHACAAVVGQLVAREGDVAAYMGLNLPHLEVVIEAGLKSPVLELAAVCRRSRVAEHCGICYCDKHVVVLLQESLNCTGQMVVEEAEVQRDVVVLYALPLTCSGGELAVGSNVSEQSAAYVCAAVGIQIIELVAVIVVYSALRTHLGV